jgi:EAL domain-containing protein (putative c-di-GMP-specific phosphodiesterase class I)
VATDTRNVLDTLAALRADGVAIAIDDFGTGYSSLSRLEHFPVDTVKIDRSFVRRIAEPTRLTPVIETILALADALNLSVVAEGIEEHHHAVALAARGCRQGQGWLFGRPMPLAELALPPVTTAQAAAAQAAAAQAAAMAAQPAGTAAQAAAAQRPVLVPAVPEPVTTEAAVAGSAPATG